MDGPILHRALGCKAKAWFRACESAQRQLRSISAHFGAMLETVARSGTNKHDVRPSGMPVDEEIAIGAILILAYARFDHLCTRHARKAAGHIGADIGKAFG